MDERHHAHEHLTVISLLGNTDVKLSEAVFLYSHDIIELCSVWDPYIHKNINIYSKSLNHLPDVDTFCLAYYWFQLLEEERGISDLWKSFFHIL